MLSVNREHVSGSRLGCVVPALQYHATLCECRVVEVFRVGVVGMKTVVVHDEDRVGARVVTDPKEPSIQPGGQTVETLVVHRLTGECTSCEVRKPVQRGVEKGDQKTAGDSRGDNLPRKRWAPSATGDRY